MDRQIPITDVMTPEPTTVDRSEPLSQVHRLLQRVNFHHLPVVDGDTPVGLIAASDILRLVYDVDSVGDRALRTFLDHQFTIDDAMSPDLQTLPAAATVREAAAKMSDGSFHSVLVVDDAGDLIGIVTTTDLMRFLAEA